MQLPFSPALFARRLLPWYRRAGRVLPWRADRDAYRVWVSEIMLQQTQVATVEAYFERFMAAYPTVGELAAAAESDVLRLWEGLGYYRRARQLHRAARQIVDAHGGRFPDDADAVRALPGIGRYTAGAILSIAFDQREPILEANTVRLLSRLAAFDGNPHDAAGQRALWRVAEAILPRRSPGEFNQALMELGSQVCAPRDPACGECPVAKLCPTFAKGLQAEIPRAKTKPRIEAVRQAAVAVRREDGRVLLVQHGEGRRWAGLWDFPRIELGDEQGAALRRRIAAAIGEQFGVDVDVGEPLATLRHSVTRFRITLECFAAECGGATPRRVRSSRQASKATRGDGEIGKNGDGAAPAVKWCSAAEIARLPLNTTGRKISRLLSARRERPATNGRMAANDRATTNGRPARQRRSKRASDGNAP